jgi:tetratricopeptide (TPR) repeat protein
MRKNTLAVKESQALTPVNALPLSEAVFEYQRLLADDPNCQFAHRELGWILVRLGNDDEGEFHIRCALEFDPSDAWANIYLGNVLWGKFEYEAAESAFQKAIALWPDSSVPYWCLAQFYDSEKRPRLAGRYYRKALELNPDDTVALLCYGRFLRMQHRNVKAKRILERLITLEPDNERANSELFEAMLAFQLR